MTRRHFISPLLPGTSLDEARDWVVDLLLQALKQAVFYCKDENPPPLCLDNKPKLVSVFEEASTRTRYSHEEAARRLGFKVMAPLTIATSSLSKNETLQDTITMLRQYGADVVVLRTKTEGAGFFLAEQMHQYEGPRAFIRQGLSLIVGGEGTLHHWTQVMLDKLTQILAKAGMTSMDQYSVIEELFTPRDGESTDEDVNERVREWIIQTLSNTSTAFVGDGKLSRVVHSHIQFNRLFGAKLMFIGPKEFRPPRSWYRGMDVSLHDKLEMAAEGWDFVYFLRTQMERLTGTPDNPGLMSVAEARRLIEPLHLTREFADKCAGFIMHAQPRDSADPIIPENLKFHRKCLIMMASAMGIPMREAIIMECWKARGDRGPIFTLPKVAFDPAWMTKPPEWWDDHHKLLLQRYEGDKEAIVQAIRNGAADDRLESDRFGIHLAMLSADKLLRSPTGKQILPGLNLDSVEMNRKKACLWLFGYPVPYHLAMKHGLVSPMCRWSHMDKDNENQRDDDSKGYRRVEYPLPPYVSDTFSCTNPNCITHRNKKPGCSTAKGTILQVFGTKGECDDDYWPSVSLQCIMCQHVMSAREAVMAEFGQHLMHV